MRLWVTAFVALAASALLIFAAMRNTQPVPEVDWLFGSAQQVPLWRALAVSASLGALVAALVLAVPALRLRLRLARVQRRIAQLEREVHGLRTLPLEDEPRDASREP